MRPPRVQSTPLSMSSKDRDAPILQLESDAPLFTAWVRAADQRAGDFKALVLAITACACATAGQSDSPMFAAFARASEQRVGHFSAPILVTTSSASAAMIELSAPLFAALARASEQRVARFNTPALANKSWAFPRDPESVVLSCFATATLINIA